MVNRVERFEEEGSWRDTQAGFSAVPGLDERVDSFHAGNIASNELINLGYPPPPLNLDSKGFTRRLSPRSMTLRDLQAKY